MGNLKHETLNQNADPGKRGGESKKALADLASAERKKGYADECENNRRADGDSGECWFSVASGMEKARNKVCQHCGSLSFRLSAFLAVLSGVFLGFGWDWSWGIGFSQAYFETLASFGLLQVVICLDRRIVARIRAWRNRPLPRSRIEPPLLEVFAAIRPVFAVGRYVLVFLTFLFFLADFGFQHLFPDTGRPHALVILMTITPAGMFAAIADLTASVPGRRAPWLI